MYRNRLKAPPPPPFPKYMYEKKVYDLVSASRAPPTLVGGF